MNLAQFELEAPALFEAETRNLFLTAERRGRWDPAITAQALATLRGYAIAIKAGPNWEWHDEVLTLARNEGLTVYDAYYLHQAIDSDAELATRDRELIAAAGRRSVSVRDVRL